MVTFEQVITHFSTRKKSEKGNFIENVHKAIDAYKYVDSNHGTLDITILYQNIDKYFNNIKPKLSPLTVRNYIRCIERSMDESIIKDNIPEQSIEQTKQRVKDLIKAADKEAYAHQKKKKIATPSVSVATEKEDETDDHIDINGIKPLDDNEVYDDHNIQNTEIISLRKDVDCLNKEIAWLTKELEWFKNYVMQNK